MRASTVLLTLIFASLLCACSKPGFDLDDSEGDDGGEQSGDPSFHGPSENLQWQLVLDDDDDDFTLRKLSRSSGALLYTILGSYSQLDNGFLELTVSSNSGSVAVTRIAALQLGDRAVLLNDFENSTNAIIALVNESECPSSDLRAGFIELQSSRDPSGDEDSDIAGAIGQLRYSLSSDAVRLSASWSLDEAFSESNEVNITSAQCEEGIAELEDLDHYLSNQSSAVIEIEDDDYYRLLALPSRDINALSTLDGDYVGFAADMTAPDDSFFISAECTDGICSVFSENDFSNITRANNLYRFEFDEDDIDQPEDGFFQTSLVFNDSINVGEGRMLCLSNDDIDASSDTTAVIACVAQSPLTDGADTRSLLNLILISRES